MTLQYPPDGRTLEGIAVPYGSRVELRAGLWEAFAPGAFAQDVAAWGARQDGARVPVVTSHPGEGSRTVVGTAEVWDTPAGVRFRARLLDTQAAREYAETVRAGANGVSVEFAPVGPSRVDRDGTLRHRAARLLAIAGAVAPAYDTARVAVRSRRTDPMTDPIRPEDEPQGQEDQDQDDETQETPQAPAPPEARSRMSAVGGRVAVAEPERRSREAAAVARVTGAAPRIARSELVYTREGEHRFLRDGMRASLDRDPEAMGRLSRHYTMLEDVARRAASVTTPDIAGTYPAEYVPGLLVDRLLKGRPAGSFFQRVPITDARTRTWPKVTEHTVVSKQVTEGVNEAVSGFATAPVSTTPGMLMGMVDVSRQVIDGGDPDAERMILDDLMESYSLVSEGEIVSSIMAGATLGTHPVDPAAPHDGIVAGLAAFPGSRFLPAEGVFTDPVVFEGLLLQKDGTGRPMVPFIGPSNADATAGGGGGAGSVLGLPVYNTWSQPDTHVLLARRADAFYYESAVVQFRYEQIGGPAAIRIGVWAYLVAVVRRAEGVVKEPVTAGLP